MHPIQKSELLQPKSQKKIADWLVKNPDKIGNLSSLEAARAIGVSDASIIRFSRAIGFDGFADLKDHVYGMLVENAFSELSLPERVSQTNERYSEIDVFSEFQKLMNQNITLSFHNNKMEDFEKAAKMLAEANRKYVIGMRGCKGIAVEFGRLLTFMTEKVTAIIDGECTSISAMQDIGKEDVVIMFAFARYYKISSEDILVIHDDLDLEVGKLRIRSKGSSGGHNGLKSIIARLETENFKRIRIGIGKDKDIPVVDYVLGKFSESDIKVLEDKFEIVNKVINDFIDGVDFHVIESRYN